MWGSLFCWSVYWCQRLCIRLDEPQWNQRTTWRAQENWNSGRMSSLSLSLSGSARLAWARGPIRTKACERDVILAATTIWCSNLTDLWPVDITSNLPWNCYLLYPLGQQRQPEPIHWLSPTSKSTTETTCGSRRLNYRTSSAVSVEIRPFNLDCRTYSGWWTFTESMTSMICSWILSRGFIFQFFLPLFIFLIMAIFYIFIPSIL